MDTSCSTSPKVWACCCRIMCGDSNWMHILDIFLNHLCPFQTLQRITQRPLLGMSPLTNCITWNLEPHMTLRSWHNMTKASVNHWMVKAPHVRENEFWVLSLHILNPHWRRTHRESCFPLVYLNVTGLTTYNVDHDSFCIRWTPHRAATSYRLKVNPLDRKCITLSILRIINLLPL